MQVKCHHIVLKVTYELPLITWLKPWEEGGCLYCRVTLFLTLAILFSVERCHQAQPTPKDWGVGLPFL